MRLQKVSLRFADIAGKLEEIESRLAWHDDQFKLFHDIILPLLAAPLPGKRKIGFEPDKKRVKQIEARELSFIVSLSDKSEATKIKLRD